MPVTGAAFKLFNWRVLAFRNNSDHLQTASCQFITDLMAVHALDLHLVILSHLYLAQIIRALVKSGSENCEIVLVSPT